MTRFKYTQTSWHYFVVSSIITGLSFNLLRSYLGMGTAMFIGLGLGLIVSLALSKYFTAVVEFKDSYLLLTKGTSGKNQKIAYADINKITYSTSTNRFRHFYIYTAGTKTKLPPPQFAQAQALFDWLGTQQPALETKIIRPENED